MQYRELGNTGMKVSAIGFGGWAIGGPSEASGTPLGWGRTTDEDSLAAIRRARDLGVTFFDTSDSYGFGRSESRQALRRHFEIDAAHVAFEVRGRGGSDIAVLKVASGTYEKIVASRSEERLPLFSADGKRVLFEVRYSDPVFPRVRGVCRIASVAFEP